MVQRLATRAPLLWVLEDLHWADRSTRDLLAYLAATLGSGRVLLVGSFRSNELDRLHPLRGLLGELARNRRVVRLELPRFSRGELAELLAGLLGDQPPVRLLDVVYARSEGNPFFAEELLLAGGDPGVLPPSLQEVLLTRVVRLGHRALAEQARQQGRPDPAAWTAAATEWERLGQPYRPPTPTTARPRRCWPPTTATPPQWRWATPPPSPAASAPPSTARSRRWRGAPAWTWPHLLPLRPRAVGVPTPAAQLGLTPREAEVLALVAAGRSNRQIAQALFISPKTVGVHVSNLVGCANSDRPVSWQFASRGAVVWRSADQLGGPLRAVEVRLPDPMPLHPAAGAAGPR
jgi:DNA-binding CsgD family transcriptional regulator